MSHDELADAMIDTLAADPAIQQAWRETKDAFMELFIENCRAYSEEARRDQSSP